jgi:WD repeat-containing protein 55
VWDDQDERIIVDHQRGGGESLDVLTNVPESISRHTVAVGLGNGSVRIVQVGTNKITAEVKHDEVEAVVALGFESEGRMISGGGQVVKVWQEIMDLEGEDEEEPGFKRQRSYSGSDSGEDESSEDERPKQKTKKQKKTKGKGNSKKQNGISFEDLD